MSILLQSMPQVSEEGERGGEQRGEGAPYDPYTHKAGRTPPPQSAASRPRSAAALSTSPSALLLVPSKPSRPGSAGSGAASVEVRQLLERIQSSQLKQDPTLAAALATLASRVADGSGKLGPQTRLRLGLPERESKKL